MKNAIKAWKWGELLQTDKKNDLQRAIKQSLLQYGVDVDTSDCCLGAEYKVIFRDKIRQKIEEIQLQLGLQYRAAIIKANEITEVITKELNDTIVLESWAVKIEKESCEDCPAFRWVVHRDGKHSCRLGFMIEESGECGHPIKPCLRPLTVGASYQIAKNLGRPEPMVGKIDAWLYDQYLAEKREIEEENQNDGRNY